MKKKRKYYYWCDTPSSYQYYDEVIYAENASQAEELFIESYIKLFDCIPLDVHTRRTDKATYLDVNFRAM